MNTIWDENFAKIVNTLHNMEIVWLRAKREGADLTDIEERIHELAAQMTDEQLEVYLDYSKERVRQSDAELKGSSAQLSEVESELVRRKSN